MRNFLIVFFVLTFSLSGFLYTQEVTELIGNNYFNDGEDNWELFITGGGIVDVNIDNNGIITGSNSQHIYVHNANNGYPSGKIQFRQSINLPGGLEEGRTYSVSFNIKSTKNLDNCFWTIYGVRNDLNDFYNYGRVELKTGNAVSYSYTFTASATVPNAYFSFDLAALEEDNVELWIDDVHMIRIPKGEELISNNYFNDGLANWQLSAIGGGTANFDLNSSGIITGNNSVHVNVINALNSYPSGRIQLTQHNLPAGLEEGEEYYLTFKIKSSKDINKFYWTIYDDPNGLDQYYNWGGPNLKAGRIVLCSETFIANATDPSVYLSFDFAAFEEDNVDIYIDDVHFVKLPKANELVKNNSFDDGAYANGCGTDWELYVTAGGIVDANIDDTGVITGSNSQHIYVHNVPNSYPSGRIQFRQKNNFPNGLEDGQEYQLNFKIKSTKNIHNCFWTIYKEKNNLDDYYNWGWIILEAGEAVQYNYTFTANTTTPNAYLSFDFAAFEEDNVELWFDDVYLIKSISNHPPETTWDGSDVEDNVPQPDYRQSVTYSYYYDEDMQGDAPSYNLKLTRVSEIDAFKNYDTDSHNNLNIGPNSSKLAFHYPKDQPWNCDMTKILVGNYFVLNAETYAIEKNIHNYSSTVSDSRWSSVEPNILYFCEGSKFRKMNVETGENILLKDFGANGYNTIKIGPDEGNISNNDGLVVITEIDGSKACLYDIENNVKGNSKTFGAWDVDWVSVSPLGNYIVGQLSNGNQYKTVRYDLYFNNESILTNETQHGDFAIDSNGDEVFVHVGTLKKIRLSDGAVTLLTPNYGVVGGHISGRASTSTKFSNNMRGWVLVSPDRHDIPNNYRTELFELKLDGSGTIRHFGHAGTSAAVTNSAYPFGCASPDGKKIAFNSDWYFLGAHDNARYDGRAYIVEHVGGANKIASNKKNEINLTWKLEQNYPNPFNPTTKIEFTLPADGITKLVVYNILGQQVKVLLNEYMQAGSYSTPFNGSNLSSGIYFYKLQSNNQMQIKKMLLIK